VSRWQGEEFFPAAVGYQALRRGCRQPGFCVLASMGNRPRAPRPNETWKWFH